MIVFTTFAEKIPDANLVVIVTVTARNLANRMFSRLTNVRTPILQ